MHNHHNNLPASLHPRVTSAYPTPAPHAQHAPLVPHAPMVHSPNTLGSFDAHIGALYDKRTTKLFDAVSHSPLSRLGHADKCMELLKYLRIYRYLFMHIYVHLASCCKGSGLRELIDKASIWRKWSSLQQLTHYSSMKKDLISLGRKSPCHQHRALFSDLSYDGDNDDNDDLLWNLLYCRRKSELYKLPKGNADGTGEREQVIELIWDFLQQPLSSSQFVLRLRAQMYRLARKSAYVPRALRINPSSISHVQPLCQGGFGMVSKATLRNATRECKVAIKTIVCNDIANWKKCCELFACEATMWQTLRHDNIVPFIGVVMDDSLNIKLVSQFFRNGSMKTYTRMGTPDFRYIPAQAMIWAKGLAEGLDYIHSHDPPIIHGDLKADNVLIDDAGHARLCDFGQSHSSDSGKFLDSSRVGLACNPVHWMAPELMGADDVVATAESDMYSFGCVLYEIISGRIPFGEYLYREVALLIKQGKRPYKPELIQENDPLWKMAKKCWVDSPRDRLPAKKVVSYLRQHS